MIEEKITNQEIRFILNEQYGINADDIREINRGTAEIFKITADDEKYILKYFSKGRSEDSVIKEINIINFLNNKEIKVPVYIMTKNGNYFVKYNNRILIIQKFIEGYTMENNQGNHEKVIESATILGKLVKALTEYKGLKEDDIFKKKFSNVSIEDGILKMVNLQKNLNKDNPNKNEIYDDLDFKIRVAKEILEKFEFSVIDKMTKMNTHGDYSVQQLIYNDKEETTIIDFETAKIMPIVWEVMRSYSYIDKEAKDGELNKNNLVEYFKEFSKYVKLNEYDLKYAAHLYLIQLITSIFGYKQFDDDYTKNDLLEFARFRTKLCKYLYNNLEEISERLLKDIE